MDKKVVYCAYLIVIFVIFNFTYGFTDKIKSWQMWNWYLVILLLVLGALLFIKYQQSQRKILLSEHIKETNRCRLQLNRLLLYEQFNGLDEEKFNQFLKKFYLLKGYEEIEIASDREKLGYDLMMWSQGQKIMLKWFKHVPLITNLCNDTLDYQFEPGELVSVQEAREAYGVMNDYEIQADQLILVSTSSFDTETIDFATRNQIVMINGEELYYELEQIRDTKTQVKKLVS